MGFSDQQLRTIKCDGPGCPKTATFDLKDIVAIQKIEWLKGVRVVATGDNRSFSYCSDVCEVKGITTKQHNLTEKSTIVPASSEAEVKAAAVQAEAAAAGDAALRAGEPATITLTDK